MKVQDYLDALQEGVIELPNGDVLFFQGSSSNGYEVFYESTPVDILLFVCDDLEEIRASLDLLNSYICLKQKVEEENK